MPFDFPRKLTIAETILINQCQKIKDGDRTLQKEMEKKGLRQFTHREIEIVNQLIRNDIHKLPNEWISDDDWVYIPRETFNLTESYSSSILELKKLRDNFYLATIAFDNLNLESQRWVLTIEDGKYVALFNAEPYLERRLNVRK